MRALTRSVDALLAATLAGLSGCSLLAPNRPVALSTRPPGANVIVDGKDSGFVTPCELQFDIDEDVRIDFEIPGFRRETRYLTPDDQVYSILWKEMTVGPQTWNFPLFLPLGDLLAPVKWTESHAPGRVFVELDRISDEGTPAAPAPGSPADVGKAPGLVPADQVAPDATEPSRTETEKPAPDSAPPHRSYWEELTALDGARSTSPPLPRPPFAKYPSAAIHGSATVAVSHRH